MLSTKSRIKKRIIKKRIVKKTTKKITKKTTKKITKKTTKKIVKRTAKKVKKVTVENIIDIAKENKRLYDDIPIKYRRKIKSLVTKCKKTGYITSDVLNEHLALNECENKKDVWNCIIKILNNNCVDLVKDEGLLKEIFPNKDTRFPESDPSKYDTVQMYLRDIGKYSLLTGKQEMELGQKISLRKKLLTGKLRKKMKPSERKKILDEGVKARNKLATANLRLVVSIAKNYANRTSSNLTLLDLVQDGADGLYKSVDKFDPTLGFKFSTYATWWIKQSIVRGFTDKSRTIRIPVHMAEATQKYQKIMVRLEQDLGRQPTVQEIASELNVDPEKIYRMRRTTQDVKQIDKPHMGRDGDENTATISDTIEDTTEETQVKQISQDILKTQVKSVLTTLTLREKDVIQLRHGMTDGIQYTLEQIGKTLGITRERVRQIEAKALEKLRTKENIKKLDNY